MKNGQKTSIDFAADVDFETILTNPILDIAARFWDKERYLAFRITYRSMRRLDDLVDNRKATGQKLTEEECKQYQAMMLDWIESVRRRESEPGFQSDLLDTMSQFSIPIDPWERLCQAMIYDLGHDGFKSMSVFLKYAEGAAVAPASIFMHLCGIRMNGKSVEQPQYDIHESARPLAIFSYLVHIMRDFQKDQIENLNYFSDDMLTKHGIDRDSLRKMAIAGEPNDALRNLFSEYKQLAEKYRSEARELVDSLSSVLEDRYMLSLEIIYSLYSQILERIDPEKGKFTGDELLPSSHEIRERIDLTLKTFNGNSK